MHCSSWRAWRSWYKIWRWWWSAYMRAAHHQWTTGSEFGDVDGLLGYEWHLVESLVLLSCIVLNLSRFFLLLRRGCLFVCSFMSFVCSSIWFFGTDGWKTLEIVCTGLPEFQRRWQRLCRCPLFLANARPTCNLFLSCNCWNLTTWSRWGSAKKTGNRNEPSRWGM